MKFFIDLTCPVFDPLSCSISLFALKRMFWVSVIVYNYGRLTTEVIRIFSFSSMFVITFEFYMVISDISSCFFDRCFLHQSAPTEAWRITLSNPTKTWSLGSNQVPLYLHKLLLGLGLVGGGGVHCLQYMLYNSAKNRVWVQTSDMSLLCLYS